MTGGPTMPFTGAVEGPVDEAVLRAVLKHVGLNLGVVYGKTGKDYLHQKIENFNQAARRSPWIVLLDLNHDADCAPALRSSLLPKPSSKMNLRIAVREIESWLMGDPLRLSSFLGISPGKIPSNPDGLDDPKETMIKLASISRKRDIREDMVPRPGSRRSVGQAYSSRMIEFVNDRKAGWRPAVAARNSVSLDRCLNALRRVQKGE